VKLHIAICDDVKAEIEYLTNLVQDWAASRKVSAMISAYDSAEAFLFSYEVDKSCDILLLDIQMKKIDGVTLAKQLRTSGEKMQIVFITGLPDFIAEGYEVSALHYLMKPVSVLKLAAVLDKALSIMDKNKASTLIETTSGLVRFFLQDIQYAEAFAHTTVIQTAKGSFEAKISIGKLEELLGDDFYLVHRSFLVSLRYIRQITKTDVIMDDGKLIPLSRRRYDAVNKAFIRYFKGAEQWE